MSAIDFLHDRFDQGHNDVAVAWRERTVTYGELSAMVAEAGAALEQQQVSAGTAMLLAASFTPQAIAMLLAAFDRGAIVAVSDADEAQTVESKAALSRPEVVVTVGESGDVSFERRSVAGPAPELYETLRRREHAGLVLFSSGTAGTVKAAVHDVVALLAKYRRPRHRLRTLAFLRFSHIGGLDTLWYSLANGSALVLADDRSPAAVCALIERHRVEVLPAAPSFLNLLALGGAYRDHDLSSLRYVTYGAEMMPQATLDRCVEMFPGVQLLQKFGTLSTGRLEI